MANVQKSNLSDVNQPEAIHEPVAVHEPAPVETDAFSQYYAELLEGEYDCVDRIVLNAYYSFGCTGGGMRMWWRQLHGSEDQLDDTHLMRMADKFGRRVRASCKAHNVPVVFCEAGQRKHEMAEDLQPPDPSFQGLFAVFASMAPGVRWSVKPCKNGQIHLERPQPWPYIRHYSFHIVDPDWGHLTIKMSAHPPFGAMIILNGHEWVERAARAKGLALTKEGNCFTEVPDPHALNQLAETLYSPESMERLVQVCDRWIYSTCLCYGLDSDEQQRSGFKYSYSVYQLEFSRNLLFRRGRELDEVYQSLIDRTRSRLDLRTLKTLFGYLKRPFARRKGKAAAPRFEAVIERPAYDLTVFKIHFKRLTLKIYDKGAHVLRIEAVAHNTVDLRCGKGIGKFAELAGRLRAMAYRFLNMLRCAHVSFLSGEQWEALSQPTRQGDKRLAGIDVSKPRTRAALEGVIALSVQPGGFTPSELAAKVQAMTGWTAEQYAARHASYDLRKMRGKQIVEHPEKTRRLLTTPQGVQIVCALLTLRDKVIKPVLASFEKSRQGQLPPQCGTLDHHYENLRKEMLETFQTLGIAA